MKTTIFLPEKIKVGFQNRSDTYTGKLAYVIYYDQKGKLRKETSWNSWRDNDIESQEYKNEPISGFVLNKKVGDYVCDWNHRQAYVRVYDPRNFEFEITIENLLYILENANSIKGKGLEGDFIYGWDGKDLILIPTESPDYKEISEYSSIVTNNNFIKAKNLKIGAVYSTKNNTPMTYMGKYDCYEYGHKHDDVFIEGYRKWNHYCEENKLNSNDYKYTQGNAGKEFFFAYTDKEDKVEFTHYKSIASTFISIVQNECVDNYADLFDLLEHYEYYSPIDDSKDEYVDYTFKEFEQYIAESEWSKDIIASAEADGSHNDYSIRRDQDGLYKGCIRDYRSTSTNKKNRLRVTIEKRGYGWNAYDYEETIPTTLQEIFDVLKPCYRNKYLANNKFYKKEVY